MFGVNFAGTDLAKGMIYGRFADSSCEVRIQCGNLWATYSGELANVKSRHRAKFDHYGLTESYFDETSGICDLMLLDVQKVH